MLASIRNALGQGLALTLGSPDAPMDGPAIEAALVRGREHLSSFFDASQEDLDALAIDPQLCEALCRLLIQGAQNPALVCAMAKTSAIDDEMLAMLAGAHGIASPHQLNIEKYRQGSTSERDARLGLALGKVLGQGHPALALATFCASVEQGYAMVTPAQHLRMALFALKAQGPVRGLARSALIQATGTATEPGLPEPAWSKVGAFGDVPPSRLDFADPGKRAMGAGARGDSMREALNDYAAIFQWRNPSSIFAGVAGSVNAISLKAALSEASAFSRSASLALAYAMSESANDPSQRRALATALAERSAQGFAGLSPEPDMSELLPGYEPRDGKPAPMAVGELMGDPMDKLALAARKLFKLSSENPMALVGDAKRAFMERQGLSNAAWRAMAANPELRDLLAKAASRTASALAAPNKSTGSTRGVQKQAEEIMRVADASGRSATTRIARVVAREAMGFDVESCARVITFGAELNMPLEDQLEALRLMEGEEAAPLRALLSGALPTLPDSARARSSSLAGFEDSFALLVEDADALKKLGAPLLKSLMARHKRHLGQMPPGEARSRTLENVADIVDCAKAMPGGFWARLDAKNPFAHAQRQHEEWVAGLQAEDVLKNPGMSRRWAPLVDRDSEGRASARELLSGRELHEEGKLMRHCVSSYSANCLAGRSRIISLRLDGSRTSTLELAPVDAKGRQIVVLDFEDAEQRSRVKHWSIVQHRGKCNAQISHPELLSFAKTITERASEAFKVGTANLEAALATKRAEKMAAKATSNALVASPARAASRF